MANEIEVFSVLSDASAQVFLAEEGLMKGICLCVWKEKYFLLRNQVFGVRILFFQRVFWPLFLSAEAKLWIRNAMMGRVVVIISTHPQSTPMSPRADCLIRYAPSRSGDVCVCGCVCVPMCV